MRLKVKAELSGKDCSWTACIHNLSKGISIVSPFPIQLGNYRRYLNLSSKNCFHAAEQIYPNISKQEVPFLDIHVGFEKITRRCCCV